MSRLRDLARAKADPRGHDDVLALAQRILGDEEAGPLLEKRLEDATPVLVENDSPGFAFADYAGGLRVYARLGMAAADWLPVTTLADLAYLGPMKRPPSRGPVA